jgi:hypothetical protein
MSAAISIEGANLLHAAELAYDMRRADADEVLAMGYAPYDALRRSIMMSGGEAWTLMINGKVAAIGGVMNFGLLQRAGIPWLLTGNMVDKYPVTFWKAARHVLEAMRFKYAFLTNVVDSRYVASLRWLKRLGFETQDEVAINNAPFTRVVMRSE